MEFKGTKGEWKVDSKKGIYAESETEIITGNIICDSPMHFNESMKLWKANAKLIACAPEMLGMLKDIVEQENVSQSCHDSIYDLIKKATTI